MPVHLRSAPPCPGDRSDNQPEGATSVPAGPQRQGPRFNIAAPEIGVSEIPLHELRLAEVGTLIRMFLPPFIPGFPAFLYDLQMFRIGHSNPSLQCPIYKESLSRQPG